MIRFLFLFFKRHSFIFFKHHLFMSQLKHAAWSVLYSLVISPKWRTRKREDNQFFHTSVASLQPLQNVFEKCIESIAMKSVGGNKVEQSGELDPRDTSGTKRCAARLSACESSLRQHTRHVARCARECAKEEDASPRRTRWTWFVCIPRPWSGRQSSMKIIVAHGAQCPSSTNLSLFSA